MFVSRGFLAQCFRFLMLVVPAISEHVLKPKMVGSKSAVMLLKEQLSSVVRESDLVSLIQNQANENQRGLADLERKFRTRSDNLTSVVQDLSERVARAQKERNERILEHAQHLQQTFDSEGTKLRMLLQPSSTWLVRAA